MSSAADPIDSLDKSCKQHDICYENEGYLSCDCDRVFNDELTMNLKSNQYTGKEKIFARSFHLYFNGSPCDGDFSTKVAPSRAIHNTVKKITNTSVYIAKKFGFEFTKVKERLPVSTKKSDSKNDFIQATQ